MPYLAFDLDAKKRVPKVARALGATPGDIAWGLLELWEHVWESKRDVVPELVVCACFGPAPAAIDALEQFGFLERMGDGWRVRGADRYLRVSEARRRGADATNAKRKASAPERLDAPPENRSSDAQATLKRRSEDALTPSTEHRAPIESKTPPSRANASDDGPPLIDRLAATFWQERRADFAPTHQDETALRDLLRKANGDEAEIDRRFAIALRRQKFPTCSDLVGLNKHWNAYAQAEAVPITRAADPRKSPVRAEDIPREAFKKTGSVDDF